MITKVLVTGANSQLAKTLKTLSGQYSPEIDFTFKTHKELDITDIDGLQSMFKRNTYDFCINSAAYTNVENAEVETELAFKVNAEAVQNLAEICKQHETTLIHISTDYVFDGRANKPYTENQPTNPINQYGKSKLLGEKAITSILEKFFIVRTSWLYSEYEGNFVNTIISRIQNRAKLEITDAHMGSPTSCKSLSKFLLFLIEDKVKDYGIYHFTDEAKISWYEFAIEISKYFEMYKPILVSGDAFKTRAKRPLFSVLDNSKVNEIYQNRRDWKAELREVINARI